MVSHVYGKRFVPFSPARPVSIPFAVLLPLVDETAAKVHTLAPSEAQTGPAIRGDHAVMKRHIEALENTPELQSLYERISGRIARK